MDDIIQFLESKGMSLTEREQQIAQIAYIKAKIDVLEESQVEAKKLHDIMRSGAMLYGYPNGWPK